MAVAFAAAPVPLSDPEIVNSGRGEYLWLAQPKDPAWWPDLIDEYARDAIAWKTVEPSQGVYDFTVIEQRLAAAASQVALVDDITLTDAATTSSSGGEPSVSDLTAIYNAAKA